MDNYTSENDVDDERDSYVMDEILIKYTEWSRRGPIPSLKAMLSLKQFRIVQVTISLKQLALSPAQLLKNNTRSYNTIALALAYHCHTRLLRPAVASTPTNVPTCNASAKIRVSVA